jgi:hypothetical protein
MNKRIKKLISESYVEIPHEREWDATESVFSEQKFAELIVLECVRHINEDYQRDYLTNWREDLSKSIKYHFGVKE